MASPPDRDQIVSMFTGDCGIAIIAGAVSDNLEVMDFDAPGAFGEWLASLPDELVAVVDGMPHVLTPSGGGHIYYRCVEIGGNQKLARDGGKTLIETRGEGGYVVAPGSPESCHKTGRPYELINGSLFSIPSITGSQRSAMLAAARELTRNQESPAPGGEAPPPGRRPVSGEIVSKCGCGAEHDAAGWRSLPLRGTMNDGGVAVEMRNCRCGSTLGFEVRREAGLRVMRSELDPPQYLGTCPDCGAEAETDRANEDMVSGYCAECELTLVIVASDIWDAIRRGGK
jgi:hypothetical protein